MARSPKRASSGEKATAPVRRDLALNIAPDARHHSTGHGSGEGTDSKGNEYRVMF